MKRNLASQWVGRTSGSRTRAVDGSLRAGQVGARQVAAGPTTAARLALWCVGVGVALGTLGGASTVSAQASCFGTAGGQLVVSLADTFSIDASCEYALRREGPWTAAPGALRGRPIGFADLYATLAGDQAVDARPRFLYGRPAAEAGGRRSRSTRAKPARPQAAQLESSEQVLALRFCSHYLMEEELAFRLRPGDRLLLERVPRAECGGDGLDLRAVEVKSGQGAMVHRGKAAHTLDLRDSRLTIDHGAWVFYAGRPGSEVALRVGQLSSKAARSPLRTHMLAAAAGGEVPALLQTRFTGPSGGLEMRPSAEGLNPTLWTEFRTAAASGAIWLARRLGGRGPLTAIEPLHVSAEHQGAAVDDAVVQDWMRRHYGEISGAMVPSTGDWKKVFNELELCIGPTYREPVAVRPQGPMPSEMTCAKLAKLTSAPRPEQESKREGTDAVRLCIDHGMQSMRSDAAERIAGAKECVTVAAAQTHVPIAIRGDVVTIEGAAADSCVVLDGKAMKPGPKGGYELLSAGLLELRTGCATTQALAVARVAVLDPERQWHPVGLFTGGGDEQSLPWQRIRHDEEDTFFYAASRRDLDTRMSYAPLLASAFDGTDTSLSEALSPIDGTKGRVAGGRPPALVTYVSRSETCPEDAAGLLRERVPVDPETVPVDGTFYVFVATYQSEKDPLRCVARARFRVHSSRSVLGVAAGRAMQMELGLLGDARAIVFLTGPQAAGVAWSLVNLRITLFSFMSFDIATSLVASAAFAPFAVSRAGLGFSAALELGIPEILPRILSVGGMVHLAAQTSGADVPPSAFVALNLSTIVDLLGGR